MPKKWMLLLFEFRGLTSWKTWVLETLLVLNILLVFFSACTVSFWTGLQSAVPPSPRAPRTITQYRTYHGTTSEIFSTCLCEKSYHENSSHKTKVKKMVTRESIWGSKRQYIFYQSTLELSQDQSTSSRTHIPKTSNQIFLHGSLLIKNKSDIFLFWNIYSILH